MLNGQNRPSKRPNEPASSPLPAGAPRSTSVLTGTKRPDSQPPSIAVLPDLRGLLLVALVAAWLAGILLGSLVSLSFWPLLILAAGCGVLALYVRQFGIPLHLARWLTLSLLLLACVALGAARLALASPA